MARRKSAASWGRKATMRVNGQSLIDLTVRYAVGYDDLVNVTAHADAAFGDKLATRQEIKKTMETYVYRHGAPSNLLDELASLIPDSDERDAAIETARATVDRLFPELVKA